MGDIRKLRKQYSKPSHPFEGPRILEELEYLGRFGLRNKKEFWRHKGQLGRYRKLARYARTLPQDRAKVFSAEISGHLYHLGLISEDGSIDAILSLKIENFLERRLQTIIYKKGYAKSISQARQLVTHGHISINGQKITTPSYLVGRDEEDKIEFFYRSPFLSNRSKIWGSESDAAQALKDAAEGGSGDSRSDDDQDRRKDRKPRRKREE